MDYIYIVMHFVYNAGTVCTSAMSAYYDKQKAIEVAKRLNKERADGRLTVSKKYGCNCVDHYFVEAISVF